MFNIFLARVPVQPSLTSMGVSPFPSVRARAVPWCLYLGCFISMPSSAHPPTFPIPLTWLAALACPFWPTSRSCPELAPCSLTLYCSHLLLTTYLHFLSTFSIIFPQLDPQQCFHFLNIDKASFVGWPLHLGDILLLQHSHLPSIYIVIFLARKASTSVSFISALAPQRPVPILN